MSRACDVMTIDGKEHSNWDREIFKELRAGGVTAVNATCAIWEDARATLDVLGEWNRRFTKHDDLITPIHSGEDIEAAQESEKTGIILGFQNTSPFEDDIALVEVFHQLGVRVAQLTYNNQSLVGGSCYEENDAGLTRYGREVIDEMNRLGMVVDLSHVGDQTTLDTISYSSRPVAITHANPNSFHEAIRNKSNQVLQALADNDGMIGLSIYPHHIGGKDVPLEEYCAMVEMTVDILGIDNVGLGTDSCLKWDDEYLNWVRTGSWKFEVDYGEGSKDNPGWPEWPEWFQSPADFPHVAQALLDYGFTQEEMEKIMGKNWFEYFSEQFEPA